MPQETSGRPGGDAGPASHDDQGDQASQGEHRAQRGCADDQASAEAAGVLAAAARRLDQFPS